MNVVRVVKIHSAFGYCLRLVYSGLKARAVKI
jgi:hypothetical protein